MKVVIIGGGGGIGASAAYNLLHRKGSYEVVLVDTRPNMVLSHTLDLENAECLTTPDSRVRPGTEDDLVDADVVVLSAAVPLRLNASRYVFLQDNAEVVNSCLKPFSSDAFEGIVLLLTNPVDPLVTMIHRQGWIPRHRLIGYTLNDSLRMRTGIAQALDVHPAHVGALVIGEHGDSQVPLWKDVTLRGEPVALTEEQVSAAQHYAQNWYPRHVALDSGRTSTWTTGLGTALMVEAIATDSGEVFPASVALDGEYGLRGVSVGVPVALGRDGVREVLELELGEGEREGVLRGGAAVLEAVAQIAQPLAG